jgi:hypothetical protein
MTAHDRNLQRVIRLFSEGSAEGSMFAEWSLAIQAEKDTLRKEIFLRQGA